MGMEIELNRTTRDNELPRGKICEIVIECLFTIFNRFLLSRTTVSFALSINCYPVDNYGTTQSAI